MRALVTGSHGFVGKHMVKELRSRGYTVDTCDIRSANFPSSTDDALWHYENNTKVYDLVVPLAYHIGGRSGIDGVTLNFAKNLQLDGAMFEWAVRTKQKRVLYFSSSAAYPTVLQESWMRGYLLKEDDLCLNVKSVPLEPQDWGDPTPDSNYGWAKLTGERVAADARKNGMAVTVVRPFSGYGEDQSLDYPFPSIVQRARIGDLSVWGPPGQTRDWIHVDDVVKGSLAVVEAGTEDPVNLCTGRGVEMGQLATMARLAALRAGVGGRESTLEPTYDESKPTGVFCRVGDPTRMLQYYTPQVTLEEGIKRALARARE